jgi:acetylornithine/succinyldiaminopimelate/putrescine aminotransferase
MPKKTQRQDFLRFVCQTSNDPIGLEVAAAEGCWIRDRPGKRHLDFISGIGVANVGHAHPAVVRAVQKQVQNYLHVMVYGEFIQGPQIRLAERLVRLLPKPISTVYFTNSGTEAVEGAIKTAKKYTQRHRLVAFDGSFHGDTQGALSVTGRAVYRKPFEPLLPNVTFLPFNDMDALKGIDDSVAAVITEPIQGEGGVNIPDDHFLPELRRRCDETGAVLIFDEVMTGLGRTGRPFAFQHWKVVPDLLVLAKALGGGMPLGAFIGRRDIMKTLSEDPPLSHVTTFGGHPVCCAAGLAALEVMIRNRLAARAARLGALLLKSLQELASIGGIIEVRGKGLLIGLEMESAGLTRRFVERCRRDGLILGWTLHSDTVVRLAPPLVITQSELDQGIKIMRAALLRSLAAPNRG